MSDRVARWAGSCASCLPTSCGLSGDRVSAESTKVYAPEATQARAKCQLASASMPRIRARPVFCRRRCEPSGRGVASVTLAIGFSSRFQKPLARTVQPEGADQLQRRKWVVGILNVHPGESLLAPRFAVEGGGRHRSGEAVLAGEAVDSPKLEARAQPVRAAPGERRRAPDQRHPLVVGRNLLVGRQGFARAIRGDPRAILLEGLDVSEKVEEIGRASCRERV